MTPVNRIRRGLRDIRNTWKKEQGWKQSANVPEGCSYVDGIVFGLTLAIRFVDDIWRNYK